MFKNLFSILIWAGILLLASCNPAIKQETVTTSKFIKVDGPNLITPDGQKFFIRGTNLGNWLNPEGYMFGFKRTSSARLIDNAFREMVGPDFTDQFWKQFKDNYVTREDIRYIQKIGMNTIRIPFHYKLFTSEDYLGLTENQDGFQRLDSLVAWCRESSIYLILDMHDAPGGQTGDNIDDSYGYPWLMTSEPSQQKFIEIWRKIAEHYKDEPVILGYDLLNEPIATFFTEEERVKLNASLEPLYKRAVAAIREVDKNHIVLLGGAQWNGNFRVFRDSKFDDKMMYTCHRYWCDTLQANIQDFVSFRDSVNLPIYMGETGENKDEWIAAWTRLMERNNIGWTYWPFKRMGNPSSVMNIERPENWDKVVEFCDGPRSSYDEIRTARPDQELAKKAMLNLLENCKFSKCKVNESYIKAMGLKP